MRSQTPGWALALVATTACSSPTSPSSTFEHLELAVSAKPPRSSIVRRTIRWSGVAGDLPPLGDRGAGRAGTTTDPLQQVSQSRAHEIAHRQRSTNAFADAERFEIHTIWPRPPRSRSPLFIGLRPPVALWSEGLAVAFQTDPAAGDLLPRWNRVPLDDHARAFKAQGRLIPIAELLTTPTFRRFDSNVTYPQAGSFVRFVLDSCGLSGVKRLFASGSPSDGAESVTAQFEAACGRTLQETEAAWLRKLEEKPQ
jgi:hypothetical protein